MADGASTAEDRALDALTRVLDSAISPEMLEAQQIILRRLALSGDLFPSRVPPPLNITEVGGYLNLIDHDVVLRAQVLAAALGVAGPNPSPGFDPVLPALYFVRRTNDRPAGLEPVTPISYSVRSDFVIAFDGAVQQLHDKGCVLPVLAMTRPLPPVVLGAAPPADLLPFLGRSLELLPAAALVDPTTDPLGLGQAAGAGPNLVVARQIDATAPDAASVPAADWSLWSCDATTCSQATVNDAFLELAPVLNAAGWYAADPITAPISTGEPGDWSRWTNITGLVAGVTRARDEIELLYPAGAIAASSVRERMDWVWDGATFVSPG